MTQEPSAIARLTAVFHDRPDRPKSYVNGGVVGNAAHMNPPEGYHVSPRDEHFRWGAYSLSTARDQAGAHRYPDYASAWDLSMNQSDMETVSLRLIAACKARDPRVNCIAEVAGTTNYGQSVHAYYNNTHTDDPGNTGGWDSSHEHHVHISFSRDDCDNYEALAPILDVICGVSPNEDDMALADQTAINAHTDRTVAALEARLDAKLAAAVATIDVFTNKMTSLILHGDAAHPANLDALKASADAEKTA